MAGGAPRIASFCWSGRPWAGRGLTLGFSRAGAWGSGRGREGALGSAGAAPPVTGGGVRRPRPPPLLPRLLAPGAARAPSRVRPAQAPRPASAVTRPGARCGQRPEQPEEPGSAAAAAAEAVAETAAAALGDRGGCGAGFQRPGLQPPPANRGRCETRTVIRAGERGPGVGGGGRSPRLAGRPPARPALLRGAFSAPAAPRIGSLGPPRGCYELPRARPGPRLRDGKLAPLGRLRQRRPPLLLLTAPR